MAHRSEPIRVLHTVSSLGLGGTEKTMQLLVSHLDRQRFLPAVYSDADGPRRSTLEAARVPLFVGGDLFAALRKFRPHVVHVHRAGWPERGRLRPLLRYRGGNILPRIVETNVFGRLDDTSDGAAVDTHLFVSRFCLERYCRLNNISLDPRRHRVLYNPVETAFFARHCFGENRGGPVVGRISRADRGKWSPLAWDFLPHLVERVPEVRFRVVGCIDEAREAFSRQGLLERVECLPPLENETALAAFFNSISVLAHANDSGESFGMVIAEAMAAGLPVVTHPCPGERDNAQLELVEHGLTGLVAPDHRDAKAYAEAVVWLLEHPDEAREMGRKGCAKAAREYDARLLAARLADVYSELVASAGV